MNESGTFPRASLRDSVHLLYGLQLDISPYYLKARVIFSIVLLCCFERHLAGWQHADILCSTGRLINWRPVH